MERFVETISNYSRRPTACIALAVYITCCNLRAVQLQSAIAHANHNYPGNPMNLSMSIGPIVALIAGILILLMPRLLNYIVAVYLIVIGLIGLFGTGSLRI